MDMSDNLWPRVIYVDGTTVVQPTKEYILWKNYRSHAFIVIFLFVRSKDLEIFLDFGYLDNSNCIWRDSLVKQMHKPL